MTAMVRCDREGCNITRQNDPSGVAGFLSFAIDGRNLDLCQGCATVFKRWLKGEAEFALKDPPKIVEKVRI